MDKPFNKYMISYLSLVAFFLALFVELPTKASEGLSVITKTLIISGSPLCFYFLIFFLIAIYFFLYKYFYEHYYLRSGRTN